MADIYLEPTVDGGQFAFLPNGDFKTIGGLQNACYMALLSQPYWGNDYSEPTHKFKSRIPELFNQTLTAGLRNTIERYAIEALSFLESEGIADEITVDVTIESSILAKIKVIIEQPDGTVLDFSYGLNWAKQAVELPFGGIL